MFCISVQGGIHLPGPPDARKDLWLKDDFLNSIKIMRFRFSLTGSFVCKRIKGKLRKAMKKRGG
ncbi:hypothetical protein ACQP3L_39115, partial [Escherichia coli]